MKKLAIAMLMTFSAGTAFAASDSMSSSDQATMKRCQGMSESAMKSDTKCMSWMKAHPDMMKNTTGSGMSGSSSSGMSGSTSGGMKK